MSDFFDDHDSQPVPSGDSGSFFDAHDSQPVKPTGSANPLNWNEADRAKFKGLAGEAWENAAANPKNIGAALTHVDIPILSPMVKRAAQAIIPKQYEDEQDAKDAEFAKEHPGAKFVGQMLGGGMLPMAAPQMAAKEGAGLLARAGTAVGNAALRVGTGSAVSAADAAARGEDASEAAKNAALFGGGLEAVSGAAKAAPWVAKKAANVFGGVREENLEKYLGNADRVNAAGARSSEEVKDIVDNAVGGHLAERDKLNEAADAAEHHLNTVYDQGKRDLNKVTPLAQAQEFSAALGNTKAKLHEMSDAADDALVSSGVSFEKTHLLDAIDQIGKGGGDAIGDEATAALAKLQATRNRIETQLPDQIDAKRLRSVLKQIRKDIDFDQASGEFNDALTGMRKEFTGQISGALKDAVPEYAQYMDQMSGIADNLGHMNRYFGTDSRALGSLESLRKGGAQAQLIEEALGNHAEVNGDQSLLSSLSDMRAKQALLGRMKAGEDLRGLLHPNEMAAAQEARAAADAKQAVVDGFERLGPNRTYGVAKNGMRDNNASFLDKKALDALSGAENSRPPTINKVAKGEMIPIDDEHSLQLVNSSTSAYSRKRGINSTDAWQLVRNADGERIGEKFHITDFASKEFGNYGVVGQSDLGEHAGKGLGTKAYKALATQYENLVSDSRSTSEPASRVWEKIGGKPVPEAFDRKGVDEAVNAAGQVRQYVTNKREPVDFKQMLDDKTVHDSFYKERPNGSRMSTAGGITGGALGYLLGGGYGAASGAAIGNNLGTSIDKYGGQMVKNAADIALKASAATPQVVKDIAGGMAKNGVPAQFMPALTNGKDDGTSNVRQLLGTREGVQRLGKYAGPLQAAAAQGKQQLAVKHYMMSQQDPEYSRLVQGGQK